VSDELREYLVDQYRSMPAAERKDELEGLDDAIEQLRRVNPNTSARELLAVKRDLEAIIREAGAA